MSSWSIPISELCADGVQVADLDLREFFQQLLVFSKSFFHHLVPLFVTDRPVDLFLLSSILFLDHSRVTPYPFRGSAKFLAIHFSTYARDSLPAAMSDRKLQEEFNNEVKCHYQTVKIGHGECRPGFSPQSVNLLFDSTDSILAMS